MSTVQPKIHLILGDGVVGRGIAADLAQRRISAVLGSRHNKTEAGHVQVDATDAASVLEASRNASHIYITLGMEYSAKVWEVAWPKIMTNVIAAAQTNGSKIIFFDNQYMYGPAPLRSPITETHAQEPSSRKGKVRKQIADQLMQAHADGTVQALIGRAADYYGPGATNSVLYVSVLKPQLEGKQPLLLASPSIKHSYTYTPDAARAMALLALDDTAYGQVWHLPTASPALTDGELVAKLGALTGNAKRPFVMPPALQKMVGLFMPVLHELQEMRYQYTADYVFSSAKFEARYPDFKITPYDEGLRAMVEAFRQPNA